MSLVKIKAHGEFTPEHLEILKHNLRTETFPQFYTNSVFKTLKFKGTHIVPASAITRSGFGSSQSVRYNGLNPKYPELKQDLLENGWQLYQKPISLRETKDKKYVFLDGRTKDKILEEVKFKNRLVNIYEIDDSEEELFAERLNAGEDSPPAGLMLQEDVVGVLQRQIEKGFLDLDPEAILDSVNLICGDGKFSSNKRDEIRWQVFHRQNNILNTELLPKSWANAGEVNVWMNSHNYVNNNKILYLPYSSTSAPKAIIAAATKAQQNPGKEIRVVIFIRSFMGYDLDKFYVKSMLKFKTEWYRFLAEIGNGFFEDKPASDMRIKLYGCIPSNIKDVCDDMDHMIIFGKNDQKIDESYFTNNSLSSFLDIDEDYDNE